LTKIADTLSEKETAGRLRQLWERWIYNTCLCFVLDLEEQKKSTFQYQYSVFQVEYSRNLWFCSGRQMEEIFQALIDRTRNLVKDQKQLVRSERGRITMPGLS
jgi:hypothetical protein